MVYSRRDCCLCDEALEQIEAARGAAVFSLEVVDVDSYRVDQVMITRVAGSAAPGKGAPD